MPTISMFYGILVLMYFYDNKKHNAPHIHAEYGEYEATIAIEDGAVLGGDLPPAKMKLVQAWIEIHRDDLMANWRLAVAGEPVFKIDPLRQEILVDKIVKAIPLENHLIEIQTSNGISGIFDVKPYLGGSAFKELLNESYFRRVRPAHHGIAWPHEQDFSADTIIWDIQNA